MAKYLYSADINVIAQLLFYALCLILNVILL